MQKNFIGIGAVETLVVLLLIGVIVSTYRMGAPPRNVLYADAQRVVSFIERVRGLAVFENKVYGLVLKGSNSVSAWQREQSEWSQNRQMANILTADIESVDDLQTSSLPEHGLLSPNIVIFRDGNISPFRWKVYITGEEEFVYLQADPTGRLSVITP